MLGCLDTFEMQSLLTKRDLLERKWPNKGLQLGNQNHFNAWGITGALPEERMRVNLFAQGMNIVSWCITWNKSSLTWECGEAEHGRCTGSAGGYPREPGGERAGGLSVSRRCLEVQVVMRRRSKEAWFMTRLWVRGFLNCLMFKPTKCWVFAKHEKNLTCPDVS